MKLFARIEAFGLLAILLILVVFGAKIYAYFKTKGVLGAAQDLKANTPLGAPSRAIDAGISAATGRTETLGGFIADLVNPAARQVNSLYGKPSGNPLALSAPAFDPYAINPRLRN